MPFQEIPQSSFGQQLGSRIGQGLSEGIPKAIDQFRLSSGLKKIGKGNLSRIQQFQALIQAGADPQMIHQLLPLIQQQQQGQTFIEQQGFTGEDGSPQDQQGQRDQQTPQGIPSREGFQPLDTSQEGIEKRAAKHLASGKFPSVEQAVAYEEKRANRQEKIISDIDSEFQKHITGSLGLASPSETFAKVPSEMQTKLLKEAYEKTLHGGINPKKAALEAGDKALEFAKARTSLEKAGGMGMLGKKQDDIKRVLGSSRKEYAKNNQLPLMVDDLITSQDLTRPIASKIAYPLTPDVKKFVESVPKRRLRVSADTSKKLADRIATTITPNDSIFAVISSLADKDYDAQEIMSYLADMDNVPFTKQQMKEFNEVYPKRQSLGDLWIEGFWKSLNPFR